MAGLRYLLPITGPQVGMAHSLRRSVRYKHFLGARGVPAPGTALSPLGGAAGRTGSHSNEFRSEVVGPTHRAPGRVPTLIYMKTTSPTCYFSAAPPAPA